MSAELKEANRAAVRRVPEVLALAGLKLAPPTGGERVSLGPREAGRMIEFKIEVLAEKEHQGWMEEKQAAGWRYGSVRDDEHKLHPCLVPYAQLPEVEKEKDRSNVREYPQRVAEAGICLVPA